MTVDPVVGPLFVDVTFAVGKGEHVALMGPNGAGKSVLIRHIVSGLGMASGRVVRPGRIGYLAQDFDPMFDGTLGDRLRQDHPDLADHVLLRAFHRCRVSPSRLDRPFQELSPGERMRGLLAGLVADDPDLLVLDEPTNHLDGEARRWLTEFLCGFSEAVLFASHDRAFVDAVADRVLELERGHLREYTGNYSAMVEAKRMANDRQRRAFELERREDRRLRIAMEDQLQRAADIIKKPTGRTFSAAAKPHYGAVQAKMDKRAKAIRSRVVHARDEATEKPFEPDAIVLDFPTRPFRSPVALIVRQLTMAFAGDTLFEHLNITLPVGGRLAVRGPNGSGKTTLFRLLTGELTSGAGEILWSPQAQWATLSQERDALAGDVPVEAAIPGDSVFVRTALARLGMRGDVGRRPVDVLSVGERTKAEIVAMMASRANILILDEPTNHLDLASTESLESALIEFPGVVIFSSHDERFVDRVATEILDLSPA